MRLRPALLAAWLGLLGNCSGKSKEEPPPVRHPPPQRVTPTLGGVDHHPHPHLSPHEISDHHHHPHPHPHLFGQNGHHHPY